MPTVHFVQGRVGAADLEVEVLGSERLLDVCDESRAPVAFSCRGATCATCRVEVLEGLDRLEPAGEAEREVLRSLGAPRTTRLACQAVLLAGPGLIRIRWGG